MKTRGSSFRYRLDRPRRLIRSSLFEPDSLVPRNETTGTVNCRASHAVVAPDFSIASAVTTNDVPGSAAVRGLAPWHAGRAVTRSSGSERARVEQKCTLPPRVEADGASGFNSHVLPRARQGNAR